MRAFILLSVLLSILFISPIQAQSTETHGHIARFSSPDKFLMEVDSGMTPTAGDTGTIYKYSINDFGGIHFTAWVSIAKVTVLGVEGKFLGFRIDEELSRITVNGEQVDHFQEGKEVKFEWYPDPPEPVNEK